MNSLLLRKTSILAGIAGLLGGCASQPENFEDVAAIGAALELENGGFEESDEPVAFSDPAFDAVAEEADEVAPADDLDCSELDVMEEAPDAVLYRAHIEWGQIPGNEDNEVARNWSGAFYVNRGGIRVRALLHWDAHDELLPRSDRQVVSFVSQTRPLRDGMVLTLIDPEPELEEPFTLSYVNGESEETLHVEVASLVHEPTVLVEDDGGNRMIAGARDRAVDLCAQGFLRGHWQRVADGRGVFRGQVANSDGEPRGHIRGIYGTNPEGEKVFFGKYINTDGEFRGLLRGHYGDGTFEGRWHKRDGDDAGVLRGRYVESIPGAETGGHFLGHWTETTCDFRP